LSEPILPPPEAMAFTSGPMHPQKMDGILFYLRLVVAAVAERRVRL
jgi:hypothetical protein